MICAPLMGETVEQMVKEMKQGNAEGAHLLEIRLDHITDFHPHHHLPAILNNKPLPLIILYRYPFHLLLLLFGVEFYSMLLGFLFIQEILPIIISKFIQICNSNTLRIISGLKKDLPLPVKICIQYIHFWMAVSSSIVIKGRGSIAGSPWPSKLVNL